MYTITWIAALLGALLALAATAGRTQGRLSAAWANRLSIAGYGFVGVSMALFVIRGFAS